jgi:hypothetical protein
MTKSGDCFSLVSSCSVSADIFVVPFFFCFFEIYEYTKKENDQVLLSSAPSSLAMTVDDDAEPAVSSGAVRLVCCSMISIKSVT